MVEIFMPRERLITMGAPGSGKSWQWLKMAESLLKTGSKFFCLDTDDAIPYMLATQFPHLVPEKGGNVHVYPTFTWPQYKEGLKWLQENDAAGNWSILDMADNAWSTTSRYFVSEIFDEPMGDYFLEARKKLKEKKDLDSRGKPAKSIMPEAFKGWVDWPVVNRLYDDFILPIVYGLKSHLYVATKAQKVTDDDDPATKGVFGDIGLRPAGQKNLGHQVHTVLLLIPSVGKDEWLITTVKDRAGRTYFKKTKLHSLYMQYLVAKAGWQMPEGG